MAMSKRQFRTKQAIEAFESCAACSTLPGDKKSDVALELRKAKARMEQQDAEVRTCTDCVPYLQYHLFIHVLKLNNSFVYIDTTC